MALIPLNSFKTKTAVLNSSTVYFTPTAGTTSTVYTAPIGVTSIVLMAQCANLTNTTQFVSFIHHRNRPILADAQGNGAQAANKDSYLVKNFPIPEGDAATVLAGKLVIESLDSLRAYSNSSGTIQLTLSILETANN